MKFKRFYITGKPRKLRLWGESSTPTVYRDLEDLPTFSSVETLDYATNGDFIQTAELNGNTDLEIVAEWPDRMNFAGNDVVGTSLTPYRLNGNGNVMGGVGNLTTGSKIITLDNAGVGFFEIYNVKLEGDPAFGGQMGVAIRPLAASNKTLLQRVWIEEVTFAGLLASAVNGADDHEYIRMINVVNKGDIDEGEFIYATTTSNTTYAINNFMYVRDCGSLERGREGLQSNNALKGRIINNTFHLSGQSGIGAQSNNFQIQNCGDYLILNTIFYGAGTTGIIAGRDLEFQNTYIGITNNENLFIQDYEVVYGSPDVSGNNPIIFRNCYIASYVALTEFINHNDENAAVVLINCTMTDNISTAINDARTDTTTYPIQNINPTIVSAGTIPVPTYLSETLYSDDFLKVTNSYFYDKGIGMRTPYPYDEVVWMTLITGTAQDGEVLTASYKKYVVSTEAETFSGETIQWYNDDGAISGATSSTYTCQTADVGDNIYYIVTTSEGETFRSLNSAIVASATTTARIDFTPSTTTGNWTPIARSGSGVVNILDFDSGADTGWDVEVTNNFGSALTNGQTGDNGGGAWAPSAVAQNAVGDGDTGVVTISGLDTGATYLINILSASTAAGSRQTNFAWAGGTSGNVDVVPTDLFNTEADLVNLNSGSGIALNGSGIITITVTLAAGGIQTCLNAMEIIEE